MEKVGGKRRFTKDNVATILRITKGLLEKSAVGKESLMMIYIFIAILGGFPVSSHHLTLPFFIQKWLMHRDVWRIDG